MTSKLANTGLPQADPEALGFSPARLARIRPAMQRYVDLQYAPGVVSLVARHGQVVHLDGLGWQDIERSVPMTTDAIFRIASMTKPVTSVALMMLYEEGNFLLHEPISSVLPFFKNPVVSVGGTRTVRANREINFRDCLTHTTGISGQLGWPFVFNTRPAWRGRPGPGGDAEQDAALASSAPPVQYRTSRHILQHVAKWPLAYHPGSVWEYGPAHDIAGVLVEEISGQTLDEFFTKRIFEPLGLCDTSFYLPEEKLSRFPAAYVVSRSSQGKIRLLERPETSEKVVGPRTMFAGGGGLLSTAADYARFAQMLLNKGELDGVRILGRKTVELMTTNHIGDIPVTLSGPGYGYGLGVSVRKDLWGNPLLGSIGSYGWGGAYCTWYFADPKEDLFGLMFTQVLGYDENPNLTIRAMFEKAVYQALADA